MSSFSLLEKNKISIAILKAQIKDWLNQSNFVTAPFLYWPGRWLSTWVFGQGRIPPGQIVNVKTVSLIDNLDLSLPPMPNVVLLVLLAANAKPSYNLNHKSTILLELRTTYKPIICLFSRSKTIQIILLFYVVVFWTGSMFFYKLE